MARKKDKIVVEGATGGSVALRILLGRWNLVVLGVLLCAGVMWMVAGEAMGAVLETWIQWILVLPAVVAAGVMAGLRITEPFARRGLFARSPWPAGYRLVMATALGLGAMGLAMLGLGTVHLVEVEGSPWVPLLVPVAGVVLGYGATRRYVVGLDRGLMTARAHRGEWLLLLAAVPVAMLLIAAAYPPGTLWQTEANGYDVMEYHLQLPREYALNNSTAPLAHNVYSYFPANVEMLYLLQMQFAKGVMGGDRVTGYVWGTYPAQYLHMLMMLLTAAAVGLMPVGFNRGKGAGERGKEEEETWLGATGRAMAVLLFLGVPWTLVTGSLAYNEAGMMLLGTLALGLALDDGARGEGRAKGVLIGLLLGLAVGCKMTAGVFFALPVAMIYLVRAVKDRGQLWGLVMAALVAGVVYLPWAVRAAVYSGGNPVFPLATSVLPRDGWTAEQSERFTRGHMPREELRSPGARVGELVKNSVLDGQWSVQPYPVLYKLLHEKEDPAADLTVWWKRVGLLWLAVPLFLAGAFITRGGRGEAGMLVGVMGVQVAVWLLATHLQGRFLLPVAVPLALLAGRGVQGLHGARETIAVAALRMVGGMLVALHALGGVFILLEATGLLGGVMLANRTALPAGPPPLWERVYNVADTIEHPEGARSEPPRKVLLIGDAKAWMYRGEVEYFTTFDSHPWVRELGDPRRAVAWLREHGVRYVVVNWPEVERLRKSYGFDAAVTREALGALVGKGVEEVRVEALPGWMFLRVGE